MTTYSLPFDRMDAKGFTMLENKLSCFSTRLGTLYAELAQRRGLHLPVEEDDRRRQFSDVVVLPQGAITCSRIRPAQALLVKR